MSTSRENLLAEAVADAVAACTSFQAWAGVDEEDEPATAARLHGHVEEVFADAWELPSYIIGVENIHYPRETTTGFNLWPEGTVLVMFEGSVDASEEGQDVELSRSQFQDQVRLIKEEFETLSLEPQRVQFKEIKELPGPVYVTADALRGDDDEMLTELAMVATDGQMVVGFRWGFACELMGGG